MKKILLLVLSLCSIASAATYTAASAAYAACSTAIAQSSSGDTVIIPEDTATFTKSLTFTHALVLQGAGGLKTLLQGTFESGYDGIISYKPDAAAIAADAFCRITGFGIDHQGSSSGQTGIYVYHSSSTPITKVRVDNNYIVAAYRGIYIVGSIYGVADNNTIENFYHGMDDEGTNSGLTQWSTLPRAFGAATNFYFEDNTLIWDVDVRESSVFTAGGTGGRMVIRYNDFIQTGTNKNLSPAIDIHGNQTAAMSFMVNEIYGNDFTIRPINNQNYIIDQRGSMLLAFYNRINTNTNTTGHYIRTREEFSDSNTSAPSGNPGTYIQHVYNSYYWSNYHPTYSSYLVKGLLDVECCREDAGYGQYSNCCYYAANTMGIREDSSWFNHNASYNGTTERGIYVGSSLPANCLTGDGAWITTQSTSNLTDYVGVNPATPISGTLYKATATDTWASYYTPYTYPHPLRGGVHKKCYITIE